MQDRLGERRREERGERRGGMHSVGIDLVNIDAISSH
jgi:hypothetical protein